MNLIHKLWGIKMNLRCKLFGHKYRYSIMQVSPQKHLAACKKCGTIWEYRYLISSKWAWVQLVSRTDKGAKEYFKNQLIKMPDKKGN